jgi:protein-L-isoaspartate(D-aspartate) O-methyltransferase
MYRTRLCNTLIFWLLILSAPGLFAQTEKDQAAGGDLSARLQEEFPGISPVYLRAVVDTPRSPFLADNFKSLAHSDLDLPAADNSIIPSPFLVLKIIEAANIKPGSSVLIAGKGTGYLGAAAAWITDKVTLVEFSPILHDSYGEIFRSLLMQDISVTDSIAAAAESGRMFDTVIVHGAVFSLNREISSFLRPSGTLIVPISGNSGYQNLLQIRYGNGLTISSIGESFFPHVGELEE